jgi:hypothetical protein
MIRTGLFQQNNSIVQKPFLAHQTAVSFFQNSVKALFRTYMKFYAPHYSTECVRMSGRFAIISVTIFYEEADSSILHKELLST